MLSDDNEVMPPLASTCDTEDPMAGGGELEDLMVGSGDVVGPFMGCYTGEAGRTPSLQMAFSVTTSEPRYSQALNTSTIAPYLVSK